MTSDSPILKARRMVAEGRSSLDVARYLQAEGVPHPLRVDTAIRMAMDPDFEKKMQKVLDSV